MAAVPASGPSSASVDGALAAFTAALPTYFADGPAPAAAANFAAILARTQTLWTSAGACDAVLLGGGPKAAALKEGVVAGLKDRMLEIVTFEGEDDERDKDIYAKVQETLDLSLALQSLGKLDPRAPYFVLEEALSSLSLDGCEAVFGFLELRFPQLKLPFPTAQENSSGLGLIRACNALLARLSQADDGALRGRVLGFMASAFSLSARSGVNLRGEFNTANVTEFEKAPSPAEGEAKEEAMEGVEEGEAKAEPEEREEGEEEEEGEEKDTVTPLNEPFYETFWSLQATFSNPSFLSTAAASSSSTTPAEPSSYKVFLARLTAVLKVFAKQTELERVHRGTGDGSRKRPAPEDDAADAEGYMPKFLTNPRLLEFELSDVGFRRQILIQALILLHFLRSAAPSPFKPPPKVFKTKLPHFAVDARVEAELGQAWRTAFEQLDATVPGGSMFSSSLVNVLRREANWASWKDAGCPPFDLPPLPVEKLEAVAAKRRRIDEQPLVPRVQHPLGTPALSELWAEHEVGGLYDLQNPTPMGDLKSYAVRIKRQDALADARRKQLTAAAEGGKLSIAAEKADEKLQSHAERKASLTFRALRQASKTSLDLFAAVKPVKPEPGRPHPYVTILLEAEAAEKVRAEEKAAEPQTPVPALAAAAALGEGLARVGTPTISVSEPSKGEAVVLVEGQEPTPIVSPEPTPNATPELTPAPEVPSVEMAEDAPAEASAPLSETLLAAAVREPTPSPSPAPETTPAPEEASPVPAVEDTPTSAADAT